jgi:hypothetical protein
MPPFLYTIQDIKMTDQLEVLFPTGKEITLQGSTYVIKPFTFGQLPKVIKAITKAAKSVEDLKLDGSTIKPEVALTILSESGEDLINLLAEFIKVERTFIEDLQMDEAINLITAFFEVNADFFTKKVLPILVEALKK